LKANPKSDPSRFTQEEAKRTLDEICRRHGIQESDSQAQPHMNKSLVVPTESAKQPRPTLRSEASLSKAHSVPVDPLRSEPSLERAGVCHPIFTATESASDNKTFHYLIRIAECTLTLHCEVNADNDAGARKLVGQIPNLLEWRQ
jgi:hypothetical protein